MKRIIILVLALALVCSAFAVDAEVVTVTGKTQVQVNGEWKTPQKGQRLSQGAMISTGFKSTMTVKIDGTVLVVQPLTRLKLSEIMQKEDAVSSEVFIETGAIKADVKPKSTKKVNFKVKTPVATASVRGTSGEITSSGKLEGSTGVWAYSGNGVESSVRSGETVIYHADGKIDKAPELLQKSVKPKKPNSLAETFKTAPMQGVELALQESATVGDANIDLGIDW